MKSKASPHLTYKWFYVVKSGAMSLSGFMWPSGFMWRKVVKNAEKWQKLVKSG